MIENSGNGRHGCALGEHDIGQPEIPVQQPRLDNLVQYRTIPLHEPNHVIEIPGVQPGIVQIGNGVVQEDQRGLTPRVEQGPGHHPDRSPHTA